MPINRHNRTLPITLRYATLLSLGLLLFLLAPVSYAQTDTETRSTDTVVHTVQPGETLFRIALRYGVDLYDLAAHNDINDARRIFVGQQIAIPNLEAPTAEADSVENPLVAAVPIVHTVQRGEILQSIAAQYGVSVEALIEANNLVNPNRIMPGDELNIWSPDISETATDAPQATELPTTEDDIVASASEAESAPEPQANADAEADPGIVEAAETETATLTQHTVQPGQHLSSIARVYGVSWARIAEMNGITNPNTIYAGMTLAIPAPRAVNAVTRDEDGVLGPRIGEGREIVVDLSNQKTYAYEDGVLQRVVTVSTGLPVTPTVTGDYAIYIKRRAQTMSGPGYYLPNVEWVMYFYRGYAFHGTYWHENFGQPMSHGCVNMTNDDAQWFYNFAEIGTPVHVTY